MNAIARIREQFGRTSFRATGLLAVFVVGLAVADDCQDLMAARRQSAVNVAGVQSAKHHPTGTPLPRREAGNPFNQPDRCSGDLWFFDADRNGQLDDAEIRLFGPDRLVECGSCHGESAAAKNVAAESVFLRISNDGSALCLACHDL